MSDIQTCGIVCPTDWVPLPLDPADNVKSWAKSTATELCERSSAAGYELDGTALRKDLRGWAEDSRSRGPLYGFAFYPDGFDTALALLEVEVVRPDDTIPRLSLDWLADTFSAHDFGPPQISHPELPIGPAVRLRQNFAAEGMSRRGPGVLLQTVTYGVLPKGTDNALVLLVSWTVPGIDEEIEDAADSIARTLTVGF
ncbi:hypothetical protein [Streptomyces sp. GbtcB6]|uniref:hypothetical protein n=1 Tax=Streptomyces sp. GbtcB6 TaxID=2824751 RepID=UPI001C2F6E8B|nr:hypothetical protein [Streptomyces sp. GbtcB6]